MERLDNSNISSLNDINNQNEQINDLAHNLSEIDLNTQLTETGNEKPKSSTNCTERQEKKIFDLVKNKANNINNNLPKENNYPQNLSKSIKNDYKNFDIAQFNQTENEYAFSNDNLNQNINNHYNGLINNQNQYNNNKNCQDNKSNESPMDIEEESFIPQTGGEVSDLVNLLNGGDDDGDGVTDEFISANYSSNYRGVVQKK